MNPGRELDALVSQKVMGLRAIPGVTTPKPYSTAISAAWEVVEKLPVNSSIIRGPGRWIVVCGRDMAAVSAEADSAPLAICLAALRAVGVGLPADPVRS